MTETYRVFQTNPYQQTSPIRYFNITSDVRVDYIYACIYNPGEVEGNGVLSEFGSAFQGFISLNISYAISERRYQIIGYQIGSNNEKILVAALNGPATALSQVNELHLISVSE